MSDDEHHELTPADRAEMRRKAAENVKRIREGKSEQAIVDVRDTMDAILGAAERATGYTRAELLEMAKHIPEPEPIADPQISAVAMAERNMLDAKVPELHAHNIAHEQVPCDALTAVKDFVEKHDHGVLILSGGIGTRKTGSACWLLSLKPGGEFAKAKHLLAIAIEEKGRYLKLANAKAVVLDDLGTEIPDEKGYWVSTFSDLVDEWYANRARVVITGNISAEQFKRSYGERAYDRLTEFVIVGGRSVRRA